MGPFTGFKQIAAYYKRFIGSRIAGEKLRPASSPAICPPQLFLLWLGYGHYCCSYKLISLSVFFLLSSLPDQKPEQLNEKKYPFYLCLDISFRL